MPKQGRPDPAPPEGAIRAGAVVAGDAALPDTPLGRLPPPKPPAFLARERYRDRRMADAARFLPVLGIVLFCVPLLWPLGTFGLGAAMVYIFAAWALLIILAAALSVPLGRAQPGPPGGEER